jgi:hypothetical protein
MRPKKVIEVVYCWKGCIPATVVAWIGILSLFVLYGLIGEKKKNKNETFSGVQLSLKMLKHLFFRVLYEWMTKLGNLPCSLLDFLSSKLQIVSAPHAYMPYIFKATP